MWGSKPSKFVNLIYLPPSYWLFQLHYHTWKAVFKYDCEAYNCETSYRAIFNIIFLRLTCVVQFSFVHSLSMPSCEYTIDYLFICLLEIFELLSFWKWYPVLQWTYLYISPSGHVVRVFLGLILNRRIITESQGICMLNFTRSV